MEDLLLCTLLGIVLGNTAVDIMDNESPVPSLLQQKKLRLPK